MSSWQDERFNDVIETVHAMKSHAEAMHLCLCHHIMLSPLLMQGLSSQQQGGSTGASSTSSFARWDPRTDKPEILAHDLPASGDNMAVDSQHQRLWIMSRKSGVRIFDLRNKGWLPGPAIGLLPPPQLETDALGLTYSKDHGKAPADCGLGILNNHLYVLGGTPVDNRVVRVSLSAAAAAPAPPSAACWEEVAPLPTGISSMGVAVYQP